MRCKQARLASPKDQQGLQQLLLLRVCEHLQRRRRRLVPAEGGAPGGRKQSPVQRRRLRRSRAALLPQARLSARAACSPSGQAAMPSPTHLQELSNDHAAATGRCQSHSNEATLGVKGAAGWQGGTGSGKKHSLPPTNRRRLWQSGKQEVAAADKQPSALHSFVYRFINQCYP
ncbi:hypothetical protein ABPG77_005265 [Micractinium sp. CCAP 211/92]